MTLQWRGATVAGDMADGLTRGLGEAAEELGNRAANDAPIETGTLRGSKRTGVEKTGDGGKAVVSFNTEYAVKQHEDLTLNHPSGGKAKYLEDQARQFGDDLEKIVQANVMDALGL